MENDVVLFQESQLTGSSNSSKRTSIKSHTVIPEINIITEQIENSLQQLSLNNNKYDSLKQNKENPAKNIANVEATTMNEPIETSKAISLTSISMQLLQRICQAGLVDHEPSGNPTETYRFIVDVLPSGSIMVVATE